MIWKDLFYNIQVPSARGKRFREIIKRRFKCDTWGTNDGRIIPVIFMRDSHLDNAWRSMYYHAIEAYKTDNSKEFDRRYAAANVLHREFIRRGNTTHGMQFNELEEIFMEGIYDNDPGYGSLDHYEATHDFASD